MRITGKHVTTGLISPTEALKMKQIARKLENMSSSASRIRRMNEWSGKRKESWEASVVGQAKKGF
jgi:hypothetical protein